jgi:hypothetical protein
MNGARALALGAVLAVVGPLGAQTPLGTVAGRVLDPTGAVVAGARVVITHRGTGLQRMCLTEVTGDYSAPALPAGTYEVAAEADGFQHTTKEATVQAGVTTTVDLELSIAAASVKIAVVAVVPQLRRDSHEIGGVVTRDQIEALPLNGRSFLELARLEPGATPPTRGSNNRTFVPVLGSPGGQNGTRTRVTVDGGSVMQVLNGASAMGLSQEVVQEFQIATVNFDLATGGTASGAINIVTRSGGNELHGGGFFFLRDHSLSAYPALRRDPVNPDPFFQRRQYGFSLGGPLRRGRVFFFGSWERNDQRSVVSVQPLTAEFARFGTITPSPSRGNQWSARADVRASPKQYAYLRYSHDGNRGFAPSTVTGTAPSALPSAWQQQVAWVDQMLVALTTTLRRNWIHELRASYFFISSAERTPRSEDCPGCIGIGWPQIQVPDAAFTIGSSAEVPNLGRRYHVSESVTWQRGSHRRQFGLDVEYNRGGMVTIANEPVSMVLFSPSRVRQYNAFPDTPAELRIPLPVSFATVEDILKLPVQEFRVGVGDPRSVYLGRVRAAWTRRLFWQDTWRLLPQLTLKYGLAWSYDPNVNDDLSKPAYLEPILGRGGLAPMRKDRNDLSPSLGLAWSVARDGKTVVRAGFGVYYDPMLPPLDFERQALSPLGVGRSEYRGSSILNTVANIPGVPLGTPLEFQSPTLFTGATLMDILAALRADLARRRGDPANRDFSVRNIELDKQGTVFVRDLATAYATHFNAGVQREIGPDLVASVDFAYRHFIHNQGANSDYNHYNSVRGPVLRRCSAAEANDPKALCSNGPINAFDSIGRAKYRGLLVRVEKRFSRRVQFLASYAFSSAVGNNNTPGAVIGFNNDDWFENYGPLDRIPPHTLSLSGFVNLRAFQVGFSSSYYSRRPFSAFVSGVDFNGDGTDGDLLPGTTVNAFNQSLGKADLERLVEQFNRDLALRRTSRGQLIPRLRLPDRYEFGDSFLTHDLRLSRTLEIRDRYRVTVVGEVFNLFNVANLQGHSGNVANTAAFAQATRRVDQVFGSGGPRAFQLAVRFGF